MYSCLEVPDLVQKFPLIKILADLFSTNFNFKFNSFTVCYCILFVDSGLYVVGSSVNDFGSNESDMDLCLMLTNDEVHDNVFLCVYHSYNCISFNPIVALFKV